MQTQISVSASETNVAEYADPDTTKEVFRIARGQRMVLYTILAILLLNIAAFTYVRIDRDTVQKLYPLLWLLSWILSIVLAFNVFSVLNVTDGVVVASVLCLLAFIPLLALVSAFIVTLRATERIRLAGYTVGLLGIKGDSFLKLREDFRRTMR